jgi:nitroreductase
MDILELIQQRQSSRVLFDPERAIPEEHLRRILEGARWAPTAHNMQNFEVLVIDDRRLLEELSGIRTETSRAFVEENYDQLSFSEEELKRKKVGLLGLMFPPAWRTPGVRPTIDEEHAHSILGEPIKMCSALLLVLYDARKRAPASEADVLGMMSLGCVMENMWLVAQSLGIGFHVQSVLGSDRVQADLRRLLGFPDVLKVGFAVRLGYPKTSPAYLRVRRDIADFTHRNRYGAHDVRPAALGALGSSI